MMTFFVSRKTNVLKTIIVSFLICVVFLSACQAPATQVGPQNTISTPVETTAPTKAPTLAPTSLPTPTETSAPIPQTGMNDNSSSADEAVIRVADNVKLGKILVDGNGMTLYIFTKDEPDKSNCTGACLEAWPPLITQGEPVLGEGIDASLVGTAFLEDGSMVVTYNKMPLYTWYKDTKPGDVTGQGNKEVWYVVSPDGNPVGIPGASNNVDDSYDEYEYSNNK